MPTTTPFNNLITFSRGSNATVTGPNGLIQWAPNNLLTFSEQFDNAAWSKNTATVTPNNAVAPDGTTTADTVTLTSTAYASVFVTVTVAAGLPYTTSVYAKAGTSSVFSMEFRGSSGVPDVVFNLADGTVTSGTGTITPAGDGWYRCSITKTSVDTSELVIFGTGFVSVLGSVRLWGAQLELGSTATTYNPTTVKNLLGFSEDYNAGVWTKTGVSIVSGAQANPVNGLFNAQKLMENTTTGEHIAYNGGVNVGAGPVTASIYAKPAGRDWIVIRETLSDGTSYVNTFFNIATGTVGTVGAGRTASIVNAGNGWYRCSITATSNAAASRFVGFETSTNGSVFSYTGDGNSGVYIYGAQLSDSASLDPYVPTPGAAPSSTAFYGPRFDFDPVTLLPRGLLVEEQRTNLLLHSADFTNAVWILGANTVTANTTTSPDGTANADTVTATATGTGAFVRQTATMVATTTYTTSCFVKRGTADFAVISPFDGTDGNRYWFNLNTGAVASTALIGAGFTNPSARIENFGNGWYRCSVTFTSKTLTTFNFFASFADADASLTVTNGRTGIIYGAQLEAGAFATSYIPTVASTVTRSADVMNVTGTNFAQWYRAAGGTIVADYTLVGSSGSSSYPFGLSNNATLTAFYGPPAAGGTGAGAAYSNFNSSAGAFDVSGVAGSTPLKLAVALADNDRAISKNAAAVVSSATAWAVPAVARLDIGDIGGTGAYRVGQMHIRNFRFIPARAADFQLQALST